MADLHPDIVKAIRDLAGTKLGRRYDRWARRRYGVAGGTLAGKTVSGEFGGRSTQSGAGVVSSAGARGPGQFIAGTRQEMIDRYGLDPWRSDKEAVRAMARYQMERGVEGYNPGDPKYKDYVLGQKLNRQDRLALRSAGGGRSADGGTLSLRGATRTTVGLKTRTIPGQSFQAERDAARQDLLLGGDFSLDKLLEYKASVNSMADVPDRKVSELEVSRKTGPGVNVRTQGGTKDGGGRAAAAHGKIIGVPYQGTHTLGNWQSDNAVDVAMPVGSKVRAPRNAVVEKVSGGYSGGASRFDGYQVTIRLANGNRLFYTHLSRPSVKPGQRLRAGQAVGRSGAANGVPHLHLGAEHGNPRRFAS
jgi:murein DD-endopeptidase MepM/ murein hydrolase activator NlpD